jgi:hypothetical protein
MGRVGTLLAALVLVTASRANAEPSGATAATSEAAIPLAETLFQRGKDLMGAGRYAEACEAFAESNRVDPATGGTLLNLAVCHEKVGKIATASAEFEQARALAHHYNRPDREQFAAEHVAALRPRVPTVTLVVHDPVADEKVLLDGIALSRLAWSSLPIDAGDHQIAATAPGKVPWKITVTVASEAATRTIDVPVLDDAPVAPVPVAVVERKPDSAAQDIRRASSVQKTTGFTLGGLGLVALGVGAAFGVAAIEENSTSEDNCPGGRCNANGALDSHHAVTDANVANVCIGAGLVVLTVATILVLTAPKRSSATAGRLRLGTEAFAPAPRTMGLGGAW